MISQLPLAARFASSLLRRSWPSYAVIFVTARCNARCVFCFNWENVFEKPKVDEITVEEFEILSRSMKPLLQLVVSGGEPYVRKDLPEIVAAFYRNSGTRMVGIPTNAYLPKAVERGTRAILEKCPGLALNINLSIDALFEKHDEVRGVKKQFHRILESYECLDALRREFPNLTVNAQTVISKYSRDNVEETIRYLQEKLDFDFHAVGPVRGSTPKKDAKEITAEQVRQVYDLHDRLTGACGSRMPFARIADSLLKRIRETELRAMDSNKREFLCLAGKKMVVISHEAKVFPCEPLWLDDEQKRVFPQDSTMGDLRETGFDIRPILKSERARGIQEDVAKEYCACQYACAIYNGLLSGPSTYPATLKRAFRAPRRD